MSVTAQTALNAYDEFLSGREITPEQKSLADRVAIAAAFGAQAYELGIDANMGAHAMIRAVLMAMINPDNPELDYLRQGTSKEIAAERANKECAA